MGNNKKQGWEKCKRHKVRFCTICRYGHTGVEETEPEVPDLVDELNQSINKRCNEGMKMIDDSGEI